MMGACQCATGQHSLKLGARFQPPHKGRPEPLSVCGSKSNAQQVFWCTVEQMHSRRLS
jgi:hypothetical protein